MSEIVMYDIKDLQRVLKIGKNTAYGLMKSDCFPSIRIGRKWLISEPTLIEWLKDNEYSQIEIEE